MTVCCPGDDGASHHGVLDMVLLTKVPDMTVFAPSSYAEVGQMLFDRGVYVTLAAYPVALE